MRDWVRAGLLGAVGSGLPSTAVALARREDPLDGARAAGRILLPREERTVVLLAAAAPVHLALSLGWAAVIDRALATPTVANGLGAGMAIAALDLGVIGRRIPAIAALPQPRQWADHAAYGVIVAASLSGGRARGRGPR